MVRRAQLGLPQAESVLTEQFLPMLYKMAIKAAFRDDDIEDFVGIAYLYFRDCIRSFDFRLGTRFITHCYARIPLQLLRQRADYHEFIHIPSSAYSDGARAPLIASIDGRPSRGEPADGHRDNNAENLIAMESPDLGAELDRQQEIEDFRFAIQMLPERHRDIIEKRLKGITFRELSADLDLSWERVRQIEAVAVEMLRRYLIDGILPPANGRLPKQKRGEGRRKLTLYRVVS